MTERPLTWKPDPSPAPIALPPGATDCHVHVFGPAERFPFAEGSALKPADAPKEALFALHDRMGIARGVIVQSAVHGFDNAVTADAIAARPGRYLGIALAPPDIEDAAIRRLSAQGFRGIRYNYMAHLAPGATPEQLRALAPRLADHGWHLQIHMEARLITPMAPVLAALPCPVVIDHMGRIDASAGLDQAPFTALRRLAEHLHVWVKLSGCERCSVQDPPWEDAIPFAATLVRDFPDRTLWGTDWPHPNYRAAPPDDGVIVGLLARIAPDAATLRRLLVENPERLYGFGGAA